MEPSNSLASYQLIASNLLDDIAPSNRQTPPRHAAAAEAIEIGYANPPASQAVLNAA